jgi:cytochrome c oxidase assembly factor CtaG
MKKAPMGSSDLAGMAGMGLITSTFAPLLVVATRRHWLWRGLDWHPAVALPAFVVVHAAITLGMDGTGHGHAGHAVPAAMLLVAAAVFWYPVLGTGRRLDAIGRSVYLFLAAPSLDLAAVVVVARGDSAGGLAMIVAMLPIGILAVIFLWRWLVAEEAAARLLDERASGGDDHDTQPPRWAVDDIDTGKVGHADT